MDDLHLYALALRSQPFGYSEKIACCLLLVSLCKRDKGKWLSAFKRDEQLPKVPSLSPADEDAHAHPELSPTTIPPAHESSPGMSPSSHRSVEAPKVSRAAVKLPRSLSPRQALRSWVVLLFAMRLPIVAVKIPCEFYWSQFEWCTLLTGPLLIFLSSACLFWARSRVFQLSLYMARHV